MVSITLAMFQKARYGGMYLKFRHLEYGNTGIPGTCRLSSLDKVTINKEKLPKVEGP